MQPPRLSTAVDRIFCGKPQDVGIWDAQHTTNCGPVEPEQKANIHSLTGPLRRGNGYRGIGRVSVWKPTCRCATRPRRPAYTKGRWYKRLVRVTADYIYYNCPRYIPKTELVARLFYSPRPDYTLPEPGWKSRDYIKGAVGREPDVVAGDPLLGPRTSETVATILRVSTIPPVRSGSPWVIGLPAGGRTVTVQGGMNDEST